MSQVKSLEEDVHVVFMGGLANQIFTGVKKVYVKVEGREQACKLHTFFKTLQPSIHSNPSTLPSLL